MRIVVSRFAHGFILSIYEGNIKIGAVEIIIQKLYNIYIENIYIRKEFRHRGYFRKIIEYLSKFGKLICLPLPEHVKNLYI